MKKRITLIFLLFVISNIKVMPGDKPFIIDTSRPNDTVTSDYFSNINRYSNIHLISLSFSENGNIDDFQNVFKKIDTLVFKLKNEKLILLKNNSGNSINHDTVDGPGTPDPSFVKYVYIRKVNNDFWSVNTFHGALCTFGYLLINSSNGESYDLDGNPVFSNDSKYIITGLVDECSGHYIELYKAIDSKIELIKKIYISELYWGISSIGWIDNRNILIEGGYQNKNNQYLLLKIK
jgi:hypothetical protein